MMRYLGDYHVHLEQGPYTMDWLVEFMETARKVGVSEVGFTEHAYRFRQTDAVWPKEWGLKPETDADQYVSLIQEAKDAGLPVKLGVEVDFAPGRETRIDKFLRDYPWDYVIGSVHFIRDWGFDRPDEAYRWATAEVEAAYKSYFDLFRAAAETGLFNVMAHPDVIKVFGYKPSGSLAREYERAAASMARAGTVFEISTAGLRKPVGELYPSAEFLDACVKAGLDAVINSDAHKPADVGRDFDRAYEYARDHGVLRLAMFDGGRVSYQELPGEYNPAE